MAAAAMAQVAPVLPIARPLLPNASLQSRSTRASLSTQPLSLPVLGWAVSRPVSRVVCAATKEEKEQQQETGTQEEAKAQVESKSKGESESDAESVTRKFGLEAGLWKVRVCVVDSVLGFGVRRLRFLEEVNWLWRARNGLGFMRIVSVVGRVESGAL